MLDLEVLAAERLEFARIATRVAPHAGPGGHHDPHGPRADGAGRWQPGRCVAQPDGGVLRRDPGLLAAAISYSVVNVRKRWYATDLAAIEQGTAPAETPRKTCWATW